MLGSPLKERGKGKVLGPDDVPMIKHHFRLVYGWISEAEWDCIDLDKLFQDYKFVQEELNKLESMRLCTLKYYGVKNPK